jgi:hypothetical protein
MSSPTDSDFRPDLPVNATGLDLVDRFQLPLDSLHPDDHWIRSVSFTAEDYLSSTKRRPGAPPRTPNGSYLNSYAVDYLLLIRNWMSTTTDDIRDAATSSQIAPRGVAKVGASTYAQIAQGVATGGASTSSQIAPRGVATGGASTSSQIARGVANGGASTRNQIARGVANGGVSTGTPLPSTRSVTARSGATVLVASLLEVALLLLLRPRTLVAPLKVALPLLLRTRTLVAPLKVALPLLLRTRTLVLLRTRTLVASLTVKPLPISSTPPPVRVSLS